MCGIYGMVALAGDLRWPERADRLGDVVRHRGPDAHGRHVTPAAQLGAHRLRVVDPTPAGDQPWVEGHRALVVNGEVYNASTLRRLFPERAWRSQADGEVLLPLLADGEVARLRAVAGQFAIAAWDGTRRRLVLARDPAGEKPLFYVARAGEVWFASLPDALLAHPDVPRTLDREAAAEFLQLGVVRAPHTAWAGIRQVAPGTAVTFDANQALVTSWVPSRRPCASVSATVLGRAFDDAVARQLRADVPVGVFLSGGLDSSLVAQAAARARPGMPAYTVGFPDDAFDERPVARRVAREFGMPLATVEAGTDALLRAREAALAIGEPIADPALLPTMLLADRAREDVTVVLSGEGADELFGGYPTYLGHRAARRMPAWLRAPLLRLTPPGAGDRPMRLTWLLRRLVEEAGRDPVTRHVAWSAGALPEDALVRPSAGPADAAAAGDPAGPAMEFDRTVYLPYRLLAKLDRGTMRVALEARAPFLDPAVAALARSADSRAHVRFRGKRLLRQVARTRLPSYILRRRKHGLSVPVGGLLNTALRSETDRLLAGNRLDALGLVRSDAVARLLDDHRARRADHARPLWTLLTFEAWRERHGLDA